MCNKTVKKVFVNAKLRTNRLAKSLPTIIRYSYHKFQGVNIMSTNSRKYGFATRNCTAGQVPDPTTGSRAVPIYQTTSYQFKEH